MVSGRLMVLMLRDTLDAMELRGGIASKMRRRIHR
jgi:hypothetical protein